MSAKQGSNPRFCRQLSDNCRQFVDENPIFAAAGCFRKKVFAPRTKVAKVRPLRARVKSAEVRPTPYVYYPRVEGPFEGEGSVALRQLMQQQGVLKFR